MLPFSNRLAGGLFTWDGQAVQLETGPGSSDALHGVAHRMPWEIASACESRASLRYRHRPGTGGWPWPFDAALGIALGSEDMEVRLSMHNIGDVAAPAALGWHPYHPFPPGPAVAPVPPFPAGSPAVGARGAAALSLAAGPAQPVGPLGVDSSPESQAAGLLEHRMDAASLRSQTTAFESWLGSFTLRLDDTHCLVAESTGCPHLVLHVPASPGLVPDYLCLEPVTLLPGALNRERAKERVANIGLAPGDVRTMSWRCRVANG